MGASVIGGEEQTVLYKSDIFGKGHIHCVSISAKGNHNTFSMVEKNSQANLIVYEE